MFPVLCSPIEPAYFLGFFTSWIRILICPCGSGSETLGEAKYIFNVKIKKMPIKRVDYFKAFNSMVSDPKNLKPLCSYL